MKVVSLASGSSGNCLYVEAGSKKILVDAGVSPAYMQKSLAFFDVKLADIDAVFLTHAHSDHTAFIGDLLKLGVPCYINEVTARALNLAANTNINFFSTSHPIFLDDLLVNSFQLSHDCQEPVGFFIKDSQEKSVAIATDLGTVTPVVLNAMKLAQVIVLEANYDIDMLHKGSYPQRLKKRILSRFGHLSNKMAGFALAAAANGREQKVLLAHLSEENNQPDLALNTVNTVLSRVGIDSFKIAVAPRLSCSSIMQI